MRSAVVDIALIVVCLVALYGALFDPVLAVNVMYTIGAWGAQAASYLKGS